MWVDIKAVFVTILLLGFVFILPILFMVISTLAAIIIVFIVIKALITYPDDDK